MFRESKYDVARNRYSLALSLLRGGYVDDTTHIATILNNLGIMEYAEGRYNEAKVLHEEALAIRKQKSLSSATKSKSVSQDDEDFDTNQEGLESLVLKMKKHNKKVDNDDKSEFITKLEEHTAFDAVIAGNKNYKYIYLLQYINHLFLYFFRFP
jgi:soluble cytochrome b562